jgi:glycosyltransferase involved in cell wall biosynthesis
MSDLASEFKTLSIVIPIYNELNTWRELLSRVEAVEIPLAKDIILVDDRSTDGTTDRLRALKAVFL